MNIGAAAQAAGLSARMLRHYEQAGLLPPATRSDHGWRQYGDEDVTTLIFIRHARDLGFSIEQIRALVGLWHDRARPSREVKALVLQHVAALDRKLAELGAMKASLEQLAGCCHGDERPECAIIDSLAQR